MVTPKTLARWLPAVAFGAALLALTRVVDRPLVIPGAVLAGLGLFAAGMIATGSSVSEAESGGWLLRPFPDAQLWQPWAIRSVGAADWSSVLG